jgi:hypothetical protein
MDKFLRRISLLLRQQFKGCAVELKINASGRVSGFLIWKGFTRLDQIDRQDKLWKMLDTHLKENDRSKIAAILTMTPEEMAYARAG